MSEREAILHDRIAFLESALIQLECAADVFLDDEDETLNTYRTGILAGYDACPAYVEWAKGRQS